MDPTAFVTRIRDHYVDQFLAFAEQQRASCTRGAAEVKLQLSERSELFDRLYCLDFIKNDGAQEIVELQPENISPSSRSSARSVKPPYLSSICGGTTC